jgi:hypothetical protein
MFYRSTGYPSVITMFEEAINYPRNDEENWIKTIAIGSVMLLLGFLFLPVLVAFGYYMRVLRGSMEGDDQPPVFDEYGEMLVDGLKAFVVAFVYLLIPGIVFGISVGGVVLGALSGGDVGAGAIFGSLLGFTISSILFLAVWYVTPAALANYARTGNIGSGFAFGELRPALVSGKYATPWLMALGVGIAAGIVVGVLNAVPILGFILAIPVNFYAAVVAFNLYGRGFEDATQMELESREDVGTAVA